MQGAIVDKVAVLDEADYRRKVELGTVDARSDMFCRRCLDLRLKRYNKHGYTHTLKKKLFYERKTDNNNKHTNENTAQNNTLNKQNENDSAKRKHNKTRNIRSARGPIVTINTGTAVCI